MTPVKLTPNVAMRARDVSRPRAEHLAEAEAAEARAGTGREGTGRESTGQAETGRTVAGVTGDERAARPGFPRRRRGPRDAGRRGHSSR